MKVLLLVTWLVPGQPANSYRVEFDSAAKCVQARQTVLDDYARVYGCPKGIVCFPSKNQPQVSAVCVGR